MLSLLAACSAYRAPLSAMRMGVISPGDIGTTRPLGVWDPLGLMTKMPEKYRRWQVRACCLR